MGARRVPHASVRAGRHRRPVASAPRRIGTPSHRRRPYRRPGIAGVDRSSVTFFPMRKAIQNHLMIVLGWLFVALALVGVVLPLVPTTPFLIVALALFSRSSPRFHQMLLDNPHFGPILKQWETDRTMSRPTKYKSTALIVVTFTISILVLDGWIYHQLMLIGLAMVLLFFIWRIREVPLAARSAERD